MLSDIKLSICCISYNHAGFIAQAIESFLSQDADFNYELVISDDKSFDGTADIIEKYAAMYPDKIRILHREQNVGMNVNFFSTLSACRGEYIAICEGDDYWTEVDKLTKQLSILEKDKSLSLVSHSVEVLDETSVSNPYNPYDIPPRENGGFDDVLFNHFIPTLSMLFRKRSLPDFWPEFFYITKNPDKALALALLLKGGYHYIPEKMGVYRHHDGGITKTPHSAEVLFNNELFLYNSFYEAFKLKKDKKFFQRISLANYSACRRFFQERRFLKGVVFLFRAFYLAPVFMFLYGVKKLIGRY